MRYFHAVLAVCISLGICTRTSAQDCHIVLHGYVTDADTKAPLAFASVSIPSIQTGTMTDENGYYIMTHLCPNTAYDMHVSHLEAFQMTKMISVSKNTEFNFSLTHAQSLHEVVIKEKAVILQGLQSESVVSNIDLENSKGLNLGETLRKLPGVTTLNTGASISKPVIHGLHSNRIAIVANNVTLEGQQWGSEHAPEIDPFAVDRVSVVKGAAGVRYGTGAMGGAVILEPAALREEPGLGGWVSLGGFSNGLAGIGSGAVDWHLPGRSLTFRVQGTAKRNGNLRAPDYWLGNTAAAETNLSAMAGWTVKNWKTELSASRFAQGLGILRAAHFPDATDSEQFPKYNNNAFTWEIGRPFQKIRHHTLKARTEWRFSERWKLSGQHALQFNHRREYDAHPPLSDPTDALQKPQISFQLWTNTFDLALEHLPIKHWQGGVGLQALYQNNEVGRGGSIPDYRTTGISFWATERWRKLAIPFEFEVGLRYDDRYSKVTTGGSLQNLDTSIQNRNVSGTLGLIYRIGSKWSLTFNTGSAWRPPHVNELFARGSNHGTAIYERGNNRLGSEKAWNNNLSLDYKTKSVLANVSIYRNSIRDFIYLNPTGRTVITIRSGPDGQPLYEYLQNDAVLQGFDANFSWSFLDAFAMEGRVSLLRAYRLIETIGSEQRVHEWLPLMPSDRYQYGLKWRIKSGSKTRFSNDVLSETYIRLTATSVSHQSRIALDQVPTPDNKFLKSPPPGFTTLALDAAHVCFFKKIPIEIGINIQNLGNIRYREYLNFFRNYVDETGVNVGIRMKIRF